MRKLVFLLITLMGFMGGCLEGKERIVTVTRYQCYDGSVVSNLNNCPASKGSAQTVSTTVTGTQATTPTTHEKTTTTCPCKAEVVKTTTTIKLGPLCTTDADCGLATYGSIRCHNGDAYKIKNTPQCVLERVDNQKHCKTLSELEIAKECSDSERCVVEQGCVPYKED